VVGHGRAARPLGLALLKEDGAPDAAVDVVFDPARHRGQATGASAGGGTGAAWHAVLKVSPAADLVVIRTSYHALSTVRHPDNRATGDVAAMLRLHRAYAEARQALGAA